MVSKLYVGGLAYSVTEDELKNLFAAHGAVESVAIIKDRETGQSKGFGFIEMGDEASAQDAIKTLNETELGGRKIMVNAARPQVSRN